MWTGWRTTGRQGTARRTGITSPGNCRRTSRASSRSTRRSTRNKSRPRSRSFGSGVSCLLPAREGLPATFLGPANRLAALPACNVLFPYFVLRYRRQNILTGRGETMAKRRDIFEDDDGISGMGAPDIADPEPTTFRRASESAVPEVDVREPTEPSERGIYTQEGM